MQPLCAEVETDLRLHIHSMALQQESLRNQGRSRLRPLAALLDVRPFRVFEEMVDIRTRVAHHLVRISLAIIWMPV